MVEYWNVDSNKEVTHLLTSLSRGILSIDHFFQELLTNYSNIPVFQYSNCERGELSSSIDLNAVSKIHERSAWSDLSRIKI